MSRAHRRHLLRPKSDNWSNVIRIYDEDRGDEVLQECGCAPEEAGGRGALGDEQQNNREDQKPCRTHNDADADHTRCASS